MISFLEKAEYANTYGDDGNIHFDRPIPKLLKRLYTSRRATQHKRPGADRTEKLTLCLLPRLCKRCRTSQVQSLTRLHPGFRF